MPYRLLILSPIPHNHYHPSQINYYFGFQMRDYFYQRMQIADDFLLFITGQMDFPFWWRHWYYCLCALDQDSPLNFPHIHKLHFSNLQLLYGIFRNSLLIFCPYCFQEEPEQILIFFQNFSYPIIHLNSYFLKKIY